MLQGVRESKSEQFPAGTNLPKIQDFERSWGNVARACNACRKLFTGSTFMFPA
jgi:hypothetical protein